MRTEDQCGLFWYCLTWELWKVNVDVAAIGYEVDVVDLREPGLGMVC